MTLTFHHKMNYVKIFLQKIAKIDKMRQVYSVKYEKKELEGLHFSMRYL